MKLTEMHFPDALPVDGYGPGFFRVGGEIVEGPIVLIGADVAPWQGIDDTAPLTALSDRVDFILLGTGGQMTPVPSAFSAALGAAGIGIEPMPSPAACRTYNILLGEGRRVALAALPV